MEKNENGYARQSRNQGMTDNQGQVQGQNQGQSNGQCRGNGMRTSDEGLQLAMVYSPYQSWRMLLSPEDALAHGTLFEELYKPLREVCDE